MASRLTRTAGVVAYVLASAVQVTGCGGGDEPEVTETPDSATGETSADTTAPVDTATPDTAVEDTTVADTGSPDTGKLDTGSAADVAVDANPCGPGTTLCATKCVDTQLDPANCGGCGAPCATGLVCSNGACGLTCTGGTTKCGDRCVDVQTDVAHCGGCSATDDAGADAGSKACAPGQVCSAGNCAVSCGAGLVLCGGKCVDPKTDRAYCGASGSCADGETGSAGQTCTAGQVCSNGACELSCQADLIDCNGKCVDPKSDRQHCGATAGCGTGDVGTAGSLCASGQVCSNGLCQASCGANLIECNGECIDPKTNETFCGATAGCGGETGTAGTTCVAGQACSNGGCIAACTVARPNLCTTANGLVCFDFQTDAQNCGGCGAVCPTGTSCTAGKCGCPASTTLCVDGGTVSCAATCAAYPASCMALKLLGLTSGVYKIDPDGAGSGVAFDVYCDNVSDGGGWTLTLKADGNDTGGAGSDGGVGGANRFGYNAETWTTADTSNAHYQFNATSLDMTRVSAKLEAFNRAPFDEVRVAMNEAVGNPLRSMWFATSKQTSLQSVFAANTYVSSAAGRASWLGLTTAGILQANCNREGLNVDTGIDARIGIVGNNEADCNSVDSVLGVGLVGSSCGQTARTVGYSVGCNTENGSAATFAYVFVRSTDFTTYPALPSCKAHLAAGRTISGRYTIDPDDAGSGAPFEAYCDMTTDGGGWTLIGSRTGNDNEVPLVSDSEVLTGNPLAMQYYNVNRAKKMGLSAISTETLFRRKGDAWIKLDKPPFDATLDTATTSVEFAVTMTVSSGQSTSAFYGWSNYDIPAGGDLGIVTDAFDHHSPAYRMLNSGCAKHYLYTYSAVTNNDTDADYDVNTPIGAWTATRGCDGNESGGMFFYMAVR